MRRYLRLLACVLAVLIASTTTASSTAYAYDAPVFARVDAHDFALDEAVQGPGVGVREGSALPSAQARGASTTSTQRIIATEAAGTGGIGPVLKGQAGVNQVAADIEASGGQVLGREITVEAGGVRTRPDLFVEDACGNRCFVEVKNGPSAGMTPNQRAAFPVIQAQGGVPVGANAAAAGLTPGVPIGPTPVWVVHVS